jgi:ParB family transcriptional regulator, chromosome partitioning protein
MAKLDELMKASRAVASESMGAPRPSTPMHGASPPPAGQTPERLKGIVRSKNAAEIPVDRIGPDPDQPREEFDEDALDRLAESLKSKGQLQPIRVRWDEGRGFYIIICGERRWRAAQRGGLETMTAVIVEGPIGAGELLALQMIENCVREDLKPVEQAKAFRSLIDLNGWSARQVARELGIVQSNVVRALALLELPAAVQDQVEQGALPPATAYEVSKLDDVDAQREVAARVVAEGLSRAETVEVVRRATTKPRAGGSKGGVASKGKPKLPTERTVKSVGGLKVIVQGRKGFDVEAWIEALEDAARQAKARRVPPVEEQAAA